MKVLFFYFKWCIYYLITMNERSAYMESKARGYSVTNEGFNGFDAVRRHSKLKKPKRSFKTFEEYKESYYPSKN